MKIYLISDILTGCLLPGYDNNVSTSYPMQPQNMNLNAPIQFDGSSFTLHNQLMNTSQHAQTPIVEDLLALGPPQSSTPNFLAGGTSNLGSFRGFDDFFPEEEIRMRSHEMLENDDMQNLLRIFSMGGGHSHAPINGTEDGYPYSSAYTPNTSSDYVFDEDRTRSSGKAVVGWLKLKAALRWGIFIRKQAAERRAQIVELDDS